ncbi:MAG: DEAD/DEAH box helicase [Verrucomicrobiae bacterium]|nr:DEAD/DEAH box helicase [Verrucomicrobiae bacterium]
MKVSKETQKALDRIGFEEASPAQAALILALRRQRSAVVAAPPASGRKFALALAAVEVAEAGEKDKEGLAVLVTATRDRAMQLAAAVRSLTAGRKGSGCGVLVAGRSPERQAAVLDGKAAILIGTPARVRAALDDGGISGDRIRAVLLDGVGDLLELGAADDLRVLLTASKGRATILALTTFISPEVEDLAGEFCPDADRVVVPASGPALPVTWFEVEPAGRLTAISLLADRHVIQRGLVFTNSPLTAEHLAGELSAAGYPAEALGSDSTATARERYLKKLRSGDLTFLVGTDAGFRDAETEPVDVVIHHDWPLDDSALEGRQGRLRPGGQGFMLVSGRGIVRARSYSRRGSPSRMGRLPVLAELPEARLRANVTRMRDALSVRNPAACRSVVDILMADGFDPAVIAGAAIRLLGTPELPAPAVPAPLPYPVVPAPRVVSEAEAAPVAAVPESNEPSSSVAEESVDTVYTQVPAEEGADWSPGISSASDGDDGAAEDGSGYTGGAYTADGYVITDDVSEDGVVYPPGANFGEDEASEYGGGGGGGGGERRRGRRERGGRSRGRAGDGGAGSPGMKRLWLNVGRMDRIQPKDIVGCILGESGVPPVSVGRVQLFERHSLVDVSTSFEGQILEALNRASVRGRRLKAKIAAY